MDDPDSKRSIVDDIVSDDRSIFGIGDLEDDLVRLPAKLVSLADRDHVVSPRPQLYRDRR